MKEVDPTGFVSLASLKRRSAGPAGALTDIRRIYFNTTRRTIQHDLAHAIELLRSLPTEDEREKARVYMDGLAQLRGEWSKPSGKVEKWKSGKVSQK